MRSARRFPGEGGEYRKPRNERLKVEVELRNQVENFAAERRRLPLGGALKAAL